MIRVYVSGDEELIVSDKDTIVHRIAAEDGLHIGFSNGAEVELLEHNGYWRFEMRSLPQEDGHIRVLGFDSTLGRGDHQTVELSIAEYVDVGDDRIPL